MEKTAAVSYGPFELEQEAGAEDELRPRMTGSDRGRLGSAA
jgi:hypothetical protein